MHKNLFRAVLSMISMTLVSVNVWAATEKDNITSPANGQGAVFVEDFEQGFDRWGLTAFQPTDKPLASIFKEKGNSVLKLGGKGLSWQKAVLSGKQFKDFVFEVDVKKENLGPNYSGVEFRQQCKVLFMEKGLLHLDIRDRDVAQSPMAFGDVAKAYQRLKVICAGSVIRVYVNGELVLEKAGVAAEAGPIALVSHGMHGYFGNVKIDPCVPPEQYVTTTPQAPDNCLVFPPGAEIGLAFQVNNEAQTAVQVEVNAAVKTWAGKAVTPLVKGQVSVGAAQTEALTLKLGSGTAGFFKLVTETTVSGQKLGAHDYPLAIQPRGAGAYAPPLIPVAAYWYGREGEANLNLNTYMHAAAHDLKEHGFNTVVASMGMTSNQVDILREYGVSVLSRGVGLIDHPAVIGAFVGDEPLNFDMLEKCKKEYAEIRKRSDKIITTCMVGDCLLSRAHFETNGYSVLKGWQQLEEFKPTVRMFRWYGVHKGYYGVWRNVVYKAQLPFTANLMVAQMSSDTPYWIILPSFGGDEAKSPNAYWTEPLGAEIKCMMHLSLAYGAKGLVFWTYQTPQARWPAFVEPDSLAPIGDKYAAAAEVAKKIAPQAALIKSLRPGGADFRCDDVLVEVVPLDNDDDDSGRVQYIYAVNKAKDKKSECRLFNLIPTATLRDVYTARNFKINSEAYALDSGVYTTGVARLELAPGDGLLLEYAQDWKQPDRAKFPDGVEKAPAANCLYLIDRSPVFLPKPGWLPRGKNNTEVQWTDVNGEIKLLQYLNNPYGVVYKKSLYAHAPITIAYEIPEGYDTFAAAAGFGTSSEKSSVIFKVYVDGKEKYNSGVFKIGQPVGPVVVDVKGGKELKLVTEDAGDGLAEDYAWWGEARLIRK